ncbi:MAG: AzlD domain-containing protein [Usitatibacteraceae bacterium]
MTGIGGLTAWLTVIIAGLITLGIRASFIVLPPDTQVPTWLRSSLKYVAAAVLPALILPDVLFRDVASGDTVNLYRIVAAIVATLFAIRTKSTVGTLCVGMATLWLMKWWGPF